MISSEYEVKSFDVSPSGEMRLSALQKLLQQAAREDCDSFGATYDALRVTKQVFVIVKIRFEISHMPICGEHFTITTWNDHTEGVTFIRAFEVKQGEELLLTAESVWALMDYERRVPLRAQALAFTLPEVGKLGKSTLPRRIEPYDEVAFQLREVRYSDLDQNNHMNNCIYTDIAFDLLPEDRSKTPKQVTALYISECREHDKLRISCGQQDNAYRVSIQNETASRLAFESEFVF